MHFVVKAVSSIVQPKRIEVLSFRFPPNKPAYFLKVGCNFLRFNWASTKDSDKYWSRFFASKGCNCSRCPRFGWQWFWILCQPVKTSSANYY